MTDSSTVPFVIGHRGAAGLAPENTLASIRRAHAEGAAWVEFDVMLTADVVPVLMHDETLKRTSNGRGRVAAKTLIELRRHDFGAWFGNAFAGETIPTLQDAFLLLAELRLGANVEIKPTKGAEAETADITCRALRNDWPHNLPPPVISSFSRVAMAVVRDECPNIACAMLFGKLPRDWHAVVDELGCGAVHMSEKHITSKIADDVLDAGFSLRAYTVNEPARAETLRDMGVTSVFTDRPDIVRD